MARQTYHRHRNTHFLFSEKEGRRHEYVAALAVKKRHEYVAALAVKKRHEYVPALAGEKKKEIMCLLLKLQMK